MLYLVEIFKTKNRMLGIALSQGFNFIIMPVWIYLKYRLVDRNYNPIHALIPFAALALLSTFFLDETFKKELI